MSHRQTSRLSRHARFWLVDKYQPRVLQKIACWIMFDDSSASLAHRSEHSPSSCPLTVFVDIVTAPQVCTSDGKRLGIVPNGRERTLVTRGFAECRACRCRLRNRSPKQNVWRAGRIARKSSWLIGWVGAAFCSMFRMGLRLSCYSMSALNSGNLNTRNTYCLHLWVDRPWKVSASCTSRGPYCW
jgi:hypothetical protein